jgi:uncharacterized membrane protein (DUF106 family)
MTIKLSTQFDSTLGFRGVWNETEQRSVKHCSEFHPANASEYFFDWPEDNPNFHYCCEFQSPNLESTTDYLKKYQNLTDYTYTEYGYSLGVGLYWDLGLIDQSFPFWRHRGLYQKYQNTTIFEAVCEYQDVIKLFQSRFNRKVICRYGLLQTALPAIALLELCVFLIILGELLYMKCNRYDDNHLKKTNELRMKEAWKIFKGWFGEIYKTMLMDWLHICLLSFVGNGLLDAVGRADPFLWTSKLFYDYTHVYLGLLIVLCISSALQQVAEWIAVDKKEHPDGKGHANLTNEEFQAAQSQHVEEFLRLIKEKNDPTKELKDLLQLTPDWKWQPIAAQSAILFCLWGYLTYIVTDDTASTVLGFVVQAASPWSGLYALRVTFITVPFIIKKASNVEKLHEAGKKVMEKYRSSMKKPEQGPLPPQKDVVAETPRPSLKPEQGPLPPENHVVVETQQLSLKPQHGPLPPKNDVVVETEKSNLKPDGGP